MILRFIVICCFCLGVICIQPAFTQTEQSAQSEPLSVVQNKVLPSSDSFFITNLTFSKDGKYLAAFFNGDKMIRVFDVATGEILSELPSQLVFKNKSIDYMQFLGDKSTDLLVLKARCPLKVVDWSAKKVKKEIPLDLMSYEINDFAITADRKMFAIAHQKGMSIWDFQTGTKLKPFFKGYEVNTLSVSPDGKYLAAAKTGETPESLIVIDLKTLEIISKPLVDLAAESKMTFSGKDISFVDYYKNNNLVVAFQDLETESYQPDNPAKIYLLDSENHTLTAPVKLSDNKIASIKFLPALKGFLAASVSFNEDGTISSALDYLSHSPFKKVKTFRHPVFKSPFLSADFSPAAKMVAAAIKDAQGVKIYLYKIVDTATPVQKSPAKTPQAP